VFKKGGVPQRGKTLAPNYGSLCPRLDRVLRVLNLFILSGQPGKRIPDKKLGFGLESGGEFFEQAFYAIFFIGLDVDDEVLDKTNFFRSCKICCFFEVSSIKLTRLYLNS